ncbi:hypothetical protein L1279_003495, partial [Planomicrobium sp. HSC-17F08]|nr:hypothetical protein [Planomicrobium sp. HSC-17F08]
EEAKAKEVAEAKKKEEEAKAKEVAEAKKKEEKAKATTKKKEQENKDFVFQKEISLHLLDLTDSINIFQELHTKIDNRYSLLKGEQVKEIFDEKFQEFIVLYTLHNMEEVQRHIPDDLEAMDLYDEATELGVQGIEELSAAISTGDSEMYLKAGKTFEKYKIAKMAAYEKLVDHIEN